MYNFSSLLNITLRVSDGLSVHHQEFHLGPANKQLTNLYDVYMTLYVPSWTPDDGRKDRPKHVE